MSNQVSHSSNKIYIYKPGAASKKRFGDSVVDGVTSYTFPKPAPTVGVSSQVIFDRSNDDDYDQGTKHDEIARKDTITFTGFFIPPIVDGKPSPPPGPETTAWIFQQHTALRAAVLQKFVTVEINDAAGVLLTSFENCNVISIDFPEGNNAQVGEYTLVFESYHTDKMDNDHIEYTYDFSVSDDTSMGYFNTAETKVITTATLSGTESITVNALDVLDANAFIRAKRKFAGTTSIYLQTGYNILDLKDGGGEGDTTEYQAANISFSTTTNPTDGTVTYASSFMLIPTVGYSKKVVGTISYNLEDDQQEDAATGSVTGNIIGIEVGFQTAKTQYISHAVTAYNSIKGDAVDKLKEFFPTEMADIEDQPVSTSVTRNFGSSSVDFTLNYSEDNSTNFEVPNVSFENISITNNPQRRIFATVPVIGRTTGPVLQDTYGKTEKSREFQIEVKYLPGFGNASGPGTESIESQYKPNGNIIFEAAASTQWDSAERRFIRSKTWVYE